MFYRFKNWKFVVISLFGVTLLYSTIWHQQEKTLNRFFSTIPIDKNYKVQEPITTLFVQQNNTVVVTSSSQTDATKILTSEYLKKLYSSVKDNRIVLTNNGIEAFEMFKTRKKFPGNEEPYFSDRQNLLDRCSREEISPVIDLSRMVYDDKRKMVMCVVPKAACTSWKRILWYLLGHIKDRTQLQAINPQLLVLGNNAFLPLLSSLKKTDALKRLLTYTTFFVSRHPFQRLVSAHSSKFTNRSESQTYQKSKGRRIAYLEARHYLKRINFRLRNSTYILIRNSAFEKLNKTEQEFVLAYIESMNSGRMAFNVFARFVSNENINKNKRDVHWRPQTALCNPCALRYDYRIKFDRLAEDSNRLLKYLQRYDPEDKQVFFDRKTKAKITEISTLNAFFQLNSKVIKKLSKLYEKDFRVLDYDNNIFRNV